ncbi:SAM domain protein [Quillaja saponaria]|uniref:SAM domain protein n=1 Tax=Quillaja saponaria TaxID=32244 RepID=A0AAD7VHH0_QUISA|nr:SAM domain protein [Quillaja saponaria]
MGTVPGKKNGTGCGKIDSSDANTLLAQHEPGDWVMVKRQRVTIVVPPLAIVVKSITASSGPCHLQPMPQTTADNPLQLPMETCATISIVDEQEKSISLVAEKDNQIPCEAPPLQPVSRLFTLNKPPRLYQRIESENP